MKKLLKEIEKYTDKYEFSFQFWGEYQNNVWIYKGGVELYFCGNLETIDDILQDALNYIERITNTEKIINATKDIPDSTKPPFNKDPNKQIYG